MVGARALEVKGGVLLLLLLLLLLVFLIFLFILLLLFGSFASRGARGLCGETIEVGEEAVGGSWFGLFSTFFQVAKKPNCIFREI